MGMIAGKDGMEKERQATRDDEGLISSTSPRLIHFLLITPADEMEIEEEGAVSQRKRAVDCRLQVK